MSSTGNTRKALLATFAISIASVFVQASDTVQAQASGQAQTQAGPAQRVYGWELMTDQERQAHRQKMRSLQTVEERQQYRLQHHKQMQERAKERGITLPDQPRAKPGMGKGRNKPGMRQGGPGRNMPRFTDYDANTDGQISQQEFTEGHAKRMQQRAAEGRKMRHMKQAPKFAEIDTDSDGNVSPEEFSAHQAQRMEEMENRQ